MAMLHSPDAVLTTLRSDGKRCWMKPRLAKGPLWLARGIVAWFLITLFFALPFVNINGYPAMFLDIEHRRFHIFGYTFLPTDTILLALFMVALFVTVFLFTAILGRLWCGWACPQTVYMEYLYRPLERLFEGTVGKGGKPGKQVPVPARIGFYVAALIVTILPAHTFLAYFVGVKHLSEMVRSSPMEHPTAFIVMLATTFLMYFDFIYFREQLCILACPYGRFQSVLLDRHSLIVSYDPRRGEPRGKAVKLPVLPENAAKTVGDCVDCKLCVQVCPTGIDIRNGLQLECINCTQCIDACNTVMDKLGRARGLIRYSSQALIEGATQKKFRPRLVFYPAILAIVITIWVLVFRAKGTADVTLLRNFGLPFATLQDGRISNALRLKIVNRTDAAVAYRFEIPELPEAQIVAEEDPLTVPANADRTEAFVIVTPRNIFELGQRNVKVRITDGHGFRRDMPVKLVGPMGPLPESHEEKHEHKNEPKKENSDEHH